MSKFVGALRILLLMWIVSGTSSFAQPAGVYLVVQPGTPGESWDEHYTDLWSCLEDLESPPIGVFFEIWVATGTYTPPADSTGEPAFRIRDRVRIYGGFAGNETMRSARNPLLNETILSGAIPQPGLDDRCVAGSGSCFEVHASGGCESEVCCFAVCAIYISCCDTAWDAGCVATAESLTICETDYFADSVVAPVGLGESRRIDSFTITAGGD